MDSPDLEGLFQSFDDKISDVCGKLALLQHYQTKNPEECLELNNIIGNIQYMILNISSMIDKQEENLLSQLKRCEDIFSIVNAQSEYIETNLSAFQVCDKPKSNNIKESNNTRNGIKTRDDKPSRSTSNNSKPVPSNPQSKSTKKSSSVSENSNKVAPVKQKVPQEEPLPPTKSTVKSQMLPLSMEEFNSISRQVNCSYFYQFYMRGRLRLEELNDFVSAFNLTIQEKYKLINSYSVHSSTEELYKRYQIYKSQENPETKDVYFCTVNDIKELSSMKSDTTIRKMIPCLRHCKRIKEIHGNPPKMI
ncbi:Spindle and kinetochore-associated protein 1, partial [Tyrophagus putrescentiae]